MDNLVLALITIIGVLLGRQALNKARYKKLKKDVWKKGFEDEGDLSRYPLPKLLREANERRRKRLNDSRNKKK